MIGRQDLFFGAGIPLVRFPFEGWTDNVSHHHPRARWPQLNRARLRHFTSAKSKSLESKEAKSDASVC